MPIYEYACKKCHHTLDALQKMSDDPLVDCPACGGPALKRLLSAPRFRLKGKGWYETDFKKDNQRNVLKSDTEPAKSDKVEGKPGKTETKKTEKKTESKPESKTDSK
ncbi:MAG: zinc ribbon domain-containing protein [Gammaproteobacteria bacterium]|nr:MAG: zinc ribbon domain-containing protein [Gammaproteobacteria bacterium]